MLVLNFENNLDVLVKDAQQLANNVHDLQALEQLRTQYLGKKGQLTELLKNLSQASPDERPQLGKLVNLAKQELLNLFNQKELLLQKKALEEKLALESLDITLPGREELLGSQHPVSLVRERITDIFSSLGFTVEEGPEIEDEYHNFDALNFPAHHPARTAQDTFYFANRRLLRTHTSPVQIRVMEKKQPPLRIITPGRVYRSDFDLTHTPMFHQLEGLVIDEQCTFANLKELLQSFLNEFFAAKLKLRFRPSYFPFTEPSAEVDIVHLSCGGKGCRVCGNSGWLEILGCGMVHPNVLRNVNIDADKYSGFAFGIGMDRLAMLRYGIDDLRMMFDNDLRFLEQF